VGSTCRLRIDPLYRDVPNGAFRQWKTGYRACHRGAARPRPAKERCPTAPQSETNSAVPPAQAASLIAVASSTTLAKRSARCPAVSVTTDPPLCIPAAFALRADLQRPEKLGILVLRIGVVQMRRGQKLIRPDLGEGAIRLRIPHVTRHGPSWGAGWWGAGRLAARHCGLQHPNLTAIKAGPFHHAAITERPYHVPKRTPLSGRRPSLPAVRSRTSARTQSKATASQTAPLYWYVPIPQYAASRSKRRTVYSAHCRAQIRFLGCGFCLSTCASRRGLPRQGEEDGTTSLEDRWCGHSPGRRGGSPGGWLPGVRESARFTPAASYVARTPSHCWWMWLPLSWPAPAAADVFDGAAILICACPATPWYLVSERTLAVAARRSIGAGPDRSSAGGDDFPGVWA
jgi:hypothetical protein